jgi:predicted DCC family thiol-disulfide oxidoreductase YuxK
MSDSIGPVVVFDGVCGLCNATVDFLMRRDRRKRLRFASNQSAAGRALLARFGVDPEDVRTVYLIEGDRLSRKSSAALRIARTLGLPWKLAYALVIVPRFLRDAVYDWVARNRYKWFGKKETCRLPTPEERARFLVEAADAEG